MSENELDELSRQVVSGIEQVIECAERIDQKFREMDRMMALICEIRDRESDT